VPPTFFDSLSPPLLSTLSSQSEYFPPVSKVMAPLQTAMFTGDDAIGVRDFISWMDSWYATQGEEYTSNTPQAKKMRVAQLHVACPIKSEAGRFVRQLPEDIKLDEEKLKAALIEQFEETEADEHAQEDILSIMSGIEQGERNVFAYSRKVLRILRRKPARVNQYDKILIRYYIDGLASQRLREMAILSFQKPDSAEAPNKVVKGVMRLPTQLKMKGYKKTGGRADTESSDEEESSGDDDSDSSSDSDDDRGYRHLKKFKKAKKSDKRSGRKNGKSKKSRHGEDESMREEMKQLRGMMQDLMRSLKAPSPNTELITSRPEPDVIPLDSYAVNRTYGGYPQQERYDYTQFNQGLPSNRQPQFPNRRNQPRPAITDYNRTLGGTQEQIRMASAAFEPSQNPYAPPPGGSPPMQPIVGPGGVLYYPARNSLVCYNCGEGGHIRPHCPKLQPYSQQSTLPADRPSGPSRSSEEVLPPPPPLPPPGRRSDQAVNVVEIAPVSSAFDGVKVREVSAAEIDEKLMKFVEKIEEKEDEEGEDDSDFSDTDAPVMAGERARLYSELGPEFEGEEGPASQRQRTGSVEEVNPDNRPMKQPVSKAKRKPIRMMAGREKFDFVGAFRDAPVLGLNWGSFFDLAPAVKKDICRLLVQERVRNTERKKVTRRGKKVLVDAGTQDTPVEEEVHSIATDRDLGDVTNFYTRGTIETKQGKYRITHILVDAGSVVNLMPIKLLRSIGANLRRANGMVIRTATNALARIAYCADLIITVAGVPCNLRVYALPDEYSPTYPMLLSRRWLQAVRAKGDYSTGRYYITNSCGTQVEIPSDEKYKYKVRETERGSRPRVPIILRDREASRDQLAAEVEEELELQETQGNGFFECLIRLIIDEAEKKMKEEEDDDAYESGTSENSEN